MNSNPTSNSSLSTSAMPPEAISRRAYELWEQEGRPEGRDLQHWLQAEQEVRGSDSTSNGHGATSTSTSNVGSASARYNEPSSGRPTTDTRPLATGRTTPAATKRTPPPSTERAGNNTSSATGSPMSGRRK